VDLVACCEEREGEGFGDEGDGGRLVVVFEAGDRVVESVVGCGDCVFVSEKYIGWE
jgi:hypothetical protein